MHVSLKATVLATFACTALLVGAGASAAKQRTKIPFADLGNIRNWESDSPNELYVQSMNRDWYRITFWAPCTSLPFAVQVGFVTDTLGQLDQYSSILVDGERCWFKTFERSEAPPEEQDPGR
jgi:hypothetical protein